MTTGERAGRPAEAQQPVHGAQHPLPGEHELRVERGPRYSAQESGLRVEKTSFAEVAPGDPGWAALAHAPILYARASTIGRFDDIPLLSYCERLEEDGHRYFNTR